MNVDQNNNTGAKIGTLAGGAVKAKIVGGKARLVISTKASKVATATVKAKAGSIGAKSTATGAHTGITVKAASGQGKSLGERIALVSGSKGTAFRRGILYADGSFKLTANHNGNFDGALIGKDSADWDSEARLQIGNYVAARGARVTLKFMSLDEARKLANTTHKIARNGKDISIKTASGAIKQYNASIEQFTNKSTGKTFEHFFQYETKKLDTNKLHFGALVS